MKSAMSLKHLGPQIDIHTGGVEHIPVHHTNEIVQSEHSFCSHPWVQFWFHLQHLQLQGTKISKSLGNVVYLSDMLDRGYSPEDVRYFFLSAHYRSFQDFTWEQLTAAKNTRTNIIKKIAAHDLSTYTTAHS
ncbi:MAG: class I tRNA ligase family protein [Candidatus Peribacteria bacterium]|nr:MAG: class I tRNA ligase family protein [Candidatus Peribacteria bacterium]